jgi:hypothetical protein
VPGQTFTAQALVDALNEGEFEHPGIVLTGMVKPSEQQDHVSFAHGGCDTWVDLPTSLIEQAEHVGSRPCEDHSHPVFRITLRESDDPQAKLFGQLLAAQPQQRSRPPFPGLRSPGHRLGVEGRTSLARRGGFHDSCLGVCDFLVRECIGFGGDYDTCIGLRATCSDICGVLSALEPILWFEAE